MLYQLSFTDFFFLKKLWPDIKKSDVKNIINNFKKLIVNLVYNFNRLYIGIILCFILFFLITFKLDYLILFLIIGTSIFDFWKSKLLSQLNLLLLFTFQYFFDFVNYLN
jgi:hypothetical protein